MSTTLRSSSSPNKCRLHPVVEIPLSRTRSGVKRPSELQTSEASQAKKQRHEETAASHFEEGSISNSNKKRYNGQHQIRPAESYSARSLTSGSRHDTATLAASTRSATRTDRPMESASTSHAPSMQPSSRPVYQLPGQPKTSKRKLGKINALMSGVAGTSKQFDVDDETYTADAKTNDNLSRAKAPMKEASHIEKETARMPVITQEIPGSQARGLESMEIDEDLPLNLNALRTNRRVRLPSPSTSTTASTSSVQPDTAALVTTTPTKTRRAVIGATPGSSAKKRSPTKAIKAARQDETGTDQKDLQPPFLQFPTPSNTPDRPTWTSAEKFPSSEILAILRQVLQQLSGPAAAIPSRAGELPLGTNYKSWLTAQPCLSPAFSAVEKDVRNVLDRTIQDGEGNCLLMIGERGIGKTAVVDRNIKLLQSRHGQDAFLVVRLSGLVQKDDKAAVREIARQLSSSSYSDEADDGNSFNSNANILSSLLAILEPGHTDNAEEAANKAKPLVIIIDEFDLFAHSAGRQSMLYCLLDCVQGGFRRGGMAVLGLSARADCFESLEKRVKSRCQSRVHHLLPAEDCLVGPAQRAKQALLLSQPGTPAQAAWNQFVENFFQHPTVRTHFEAMQDLRGLDGDRKLLDVLTLILAKQAAVMSERRGHDAVHLPVLTPMDLGLHSQAPERHLPNSLNMAEYALLIACKHLTEEEKPVNFVIAYERYIDHCKRAAAAGTSTSRAYGRGLCLRAFESLKKQGLVKEATASGKQAVGGGSIFRLCRLVPWPFMIEEAVKGRKDLPQHLVKWCKAWSD